MSNDKIKFGDVCSAAVTRSAGDNEFVTLDGYYTITCNAADGSVKWEDDIKNLVTTVGKNLTMDTVLGNSAAGAVEVLN